jgi:hypothetical protein
MYYVTYCQYHDGDHVNGVRLHLWTAATSGLIVHPSCHIWAWRTMVDGVNWGKHLILPPVRSLAVLPAKPSTIKLRWYRQREWWVLSTNYFFHTCRVLLHAIKSYNMRPPALLPLERKVCCRFLLPLKPHWLIWVWTHEPWVQWQAH